MRNRITFLLLLHTAMVFCQTATVSSSFEDKTFEPEIGSARFEAGTSGGYFLVPNPHPDDVNRSNYVLKVFTEPGTKGRAEYAISRMETNEKTYIYSWKTYYPSGFWKDVDRWFCAQNQWKTWPCESGGTGKYAAYDTLICKGAGIFNDMVFYENGKLNYRSRAYPDCKSDSITIEEGRWQEFTLEVYWTTSNKGYYRIWKNGTLCGYANNYKTLFDNFLEGTCNIYWTTGLYSGWAKNGNKTQDSLIAYIDDVAIYDADSNYSIKDVCSTCEAVPGGTTEISADTPAVLSVYPNPVKNNFFVLGKTTPLSITIYTCDGRKVKHDENTDNVNISDLGKGVYIVLINFRESFVTRKVIKN